MLKKIVLVMFFVLNLFATTIEVKQSNNIYLNYMKKMAIYEDKIFLMPDDSFGLFVANINNNTVDTQIDISSDSYFMDLTIYKDKVYVIDDGGKIFIIDVNSYQFSEKAITQNALALIVDSDKIYIANASGSIVVYDLELNEIEKINYNYSNAIELKIKNSRLYGIFESGEIAYYDFETKEWSKKQKDTPSDFLFYGDNVYVSTANKIFIYDKDLNEIKTISHDSLMDNIKSLSILNDTLYFANYNSSTIGEVSLAQNDILASYTNSAKNPLNLLTLNDKIYILTSNILEYFYPDGNLIVKQKIDENYQAVDEIIAKQGDSIQIKIEGGSGNFEIITTNGVVINKISEFEYELITSSALSGLAKITIEDKSTSESKSIFVNIGGKFTLSSDESSINIGSYVIIYVDGGYPPYNLTTSSGSLIKSSSKNYIFYPSISGEHKINATDSKGNKKEITINVIKEIALSPAISYMRPNEERSFKVIGADSEFNVISSCGEESIDKREKVGDEWLIFYKAPSTTSQNCKITLNSNSKSVNSIVNIYDERLSSDISKLTLKRGESTTLTALNGTNEYFWRSEQGTLSNLQGKSVTYTAPEKTGIDKIILSDTSGNSFTIEAEITGDFHISPTNPFVNLGEEITIKAIGGVGKIKWTLEDGEEIDKSDNSITLKAPNQSGKYEIMAIDENGNKAISLLSIVTSTLNISTSSTTITKNSTLNLKVNGGVEPYFWSTTNGYLSSYEGKYTNFTPSNIENNLSVVVTDSMGNISKVDLRVIENETSTKVLNVKKGWNLVSIPVNKSIPSNEFKNYKSIYTFNDKWEQNPNEIEAKVGFWINSNEKQKMLFEGESYFIDLNNLSNSWQLLGSGNLIEPNYSINSYKIWVFKNSEWNENPSNISAGEGFWVKK